MENGVVPTPKIPEIPEKVGHSINFVRDNQSYPISHFAEYYIELIKTNFNQLLFFILKIRSEVALVAYKV